MEFDANIPVIKVMPDTLSTEKIYQTNTDNLSMCAVLERHKGTGNIGKAYVKGFDLVCGAVAQTIGHDSHNITVVGTNAHDMAAAVNALGKDGGIAVVIDGKLTHRMSLPIAGLMSDKPAQEAIEDYKKIKQQINVLAPGSRVDTLMMLSFLSLCVIPQIRVSDKGLFDVDKMEFLTK